MAEVRVDDRDAIFRVPRILMPMFDICIRIGGPDRTRTDGLCDANAALSQLSYGPAGILNGLSAESLTYG